jgi:hypothetical protein
MSRKQFLLDDTPPHDCYELIFSFCRGLQIEEKEDMSENQVAEDQVSRRRVLKILIGTASTAASLPVIGEGEARLARPACHLASPPVELAAHQPKFFRPEETRTLEALSETIIPADDHSPGAKAARVWEYIDEIVADADEGTKDLWTQGLASLKGMAEREHGKSFEDCTVDQQVALVQKISANEENPARPEERFFAAAKRATIDGYYTSSIGIHQDLQYQGNTALGRIPRLCAPGTPDVAFGHGPWFGLCPGDRRSAAQGVPRREYPAGKLAQMNWRYMTDVFDVCVIGSGPAGGVLSKELAEAGAKVALVEGGREIQREEFHSLTKGAYALDVCVCGVEDGSATGSGVGGAERHGWPGLDRRRNRARRPALRRDYYRNGDQECRDRSELSARAGGFGGR